MPRRLSARRQVVGPGSSAEPDAEHGIRHRYPGC
jgi:hypothetical protein